MGTSLNDTSGWIKDIFYRLRKLESGSFLESSSISHGRMRFIGGLLLIDSGGTLQVVGHLSGDGDFVWSGPWAFTGEGEITGNVDLTGNLDVVDSGKITNGDVRIEDNKIHVGGMVLDPAVAGGALVFPNGSRLESDATNGGDRLVVGDAVVNVGNVTSIRKGSSSVIVSSNSVTVNAAGGGQVTLLGEVIIPTANIPTYGGSGLPQGTLRLTGGGQLQRADGT